MHRQSYPVASGVKIVENSSRFETFVWNRDCAVRKVSLLGTPWGQLEWLLIFTQLMSLLADLDSSAYWRRWKSLTWNGSC